ncbi:asparagine synthase (glutamine-hydrolyzing) [Methanocella arvoryzae]|uniref:Putative asparagine synthetase [glutamine-hydrolyzing] n=1 Tax=Methanocella arvoryzae (strain DSM 22066 / NBRC 105507 / MRE50) TaxID=351160 RepID=Q0W3C4_METAR|nr:asparagine synthase (glutamine-hydrolyzing) [Methanocella arvoryzae]CAJ37119.1 asparagine synthetase, glutamine-hydrolyzing [Methanocella arvoryzae MRE50]
MCGINGFNWKDLRLISQMNDVTRHRGPDDHGIYQDEMVSLGHNRLSIIDLSEKGRQPMSSEDGTVWITYNGEIYNYRELRRELLEKGHRFRSDTDTEVIIHAYEEFGHDFVRRLRGMWAFCIYDQNRGTLLLSRDQFGIKPLYYHLSPGKIIFSSMISGILCHEIQTAPRARAIMEYLAFNLEDHGTDTFFENIQSLATDSLLLYDLKSHEHRYLKWYDRKPRTTATAAAPDIKTLFTESVRQRTIADVPIGSCLSGGVDSSAIVCILDQLLDGDFCTYSFVVPGSPIDESKYIREIGRTTGARQLFTALDPDSFLAEIADFVAAQEEPVGGLSPYAQYRVMKLAHEHGAKVLLDGQGGDELFAGYVYYYSYYFYELFRSFRWLKLAREMLLYSRNSRKTYSSALFGFLLLPRAIQVRLWKSRLNTWINHAYLKQVCGDTYDPRWSRMPLNDILNLSLFSTAIPEMMRWEDKNSMRWSIETRPPFLDVDLVEAMASVPAEEKLQDGKTKVIFRKAMDDILPPLIRDRKDKIGFAAPADEFFRNEKIIAFCENIIYSDSFRSRPYWKWPEVEKIFRDHITGRRNAGDLIFKWINLELWLRHFFEGRNISGAGPIPVFTSTP